MGKSVAKPGTRKRVSTSPINFRMPTPLRARVRRYATQRHLGEAEALRLLVSERLDEEESAIELAAAERWQFEQAYATWDRFRQGRGRTVPRERIEQIFTRALEHKSARAARKG